MPDTQPEVEMNAAPTIACSVCGVEVSHYRDDEGNHYCGEHNPEQADAALDADDPPDATEQFERAADAGVYGAVRPV